MLLLRFDITLIFLTRQNFPTNWIEKIFFVYFNIFSKIQKMLRNPKSGFDTSLLSASVLRTKQNQPKTDLFQTRTLLYKNHLF
jgi:hypothetical protein